jgi:beta-aspartyl-peptidase (threonine type)
MAALRAGGGALDAVEEAVRALEACEVLNAGRGSVLNAAGEVEMDACIVEGSGRGVGALAAVRRLVHPVSGARLVMEQSPHVLLVGEAADRFGAARGLETAEPGWFVTSLRRSQLERAQAADRIHLDHAGEDDPEGEDPGTQGTVGAVARDAAGHLAAATSTGGLTNQWPGRIGDTPLVGAGTWADDATCAVSATGPGELFIRCGFAHEVDAGLRHAGLSVAEACDVALARVAALGGRGGCIAVDAAGNLALPFTTAIMYRGSARFDRDSRIEIGDVG